MCFVLTFIHELNSFPSKVSQPEIPPFLAQLVHFPLIIIDHFAIVNLKLVIKAERL